MNLIEIEKFFIVSTTQFDSILSDMNINLSNLDSNYFITYIVLNLFAYLVIYLIIKLLLYTLNKFFGIRIINAIIG